MTLVISNICIVADYECSFEADWCGFTQVTGSTPRLWGVDQLDWSRDTTSNPSSLTGPESDHTFDTTNGERIQALMGYYFYINKGTRSI